MQGGIFGQVAKATAPRNFYGNTAAEQAKVDRWAAAIGPRTNRANFDTVLKTAPRGGKQPAFAALVALIPRMPPAEVHALIAAGRLKKSSGSMLGQVGGNFARMGKESAKAAKKGGKALGKAAGKLTNNPIWDIAQTGVSFIPGVGTAVSAGMAGAAAVGRGASLANIGLAAARGAIPGGTLAQAAFDVGVGLAKGDPVDQAALGAIRNQIPGGAAGRAAFDAGRQIAAGGNVGAAALRNVPALAPTPAALSTARNIASRAAAANPAQLRQIRRGVSGIVHLAKRGDRQAQQVLGAISHQGGIPMPSRGRAAQRGIPGGVQQAIQQAIQRKLASTTAPHQAALHRAERQFARAVQAAPRMARGRPAAPPAHRSAWGFAPWGRSPQTAAALPRSVLVRGR